MLGTVSYERVELSYRRLGSGALNSKARAMRRKFCRRGLASTPDARQSGTMGKSNEWFEGKQVTLEGFEAGQASKAMSRGPGGMVAPL